MFDTLLSKFTLMPGKTKEDYQACKPYPPYWCTAERWSALCDLFSQDAKFQKKSEAGRVNRSKQQIRSTSASRAHFLVRTDMAKELGREPSVREWWYKTHTHNDQWSTPAVEAVYEKYNALFSEKYKDVVLEQQPPFDAALWKAVLDRRDVGVHHKQALGGLDPDFHSVSSSSTTVHMTVSSTLEATPPSDQFATKEYIDSRLTSFSQSIEQSISQSISQVLNAMNKNKAKAPAPGTMLEEEEYQMETEEDLHDPYYEQRRRMKEKGKIRKHWM